MSARILLLTGRPGVGKTTVIARVAEGLGPRSVRGFITEEIRSRGIRKGFKLRTFGGKERTLSHVSIRSQHRVGRYGVDLEAVLECVEESLLAHPTPDVYLVDEIGKMECLSEIFVRAMERCFDSGVPVVATVALRGGGFIARAKEHPDAETWEVTVQNRDALPDRVLSWVPNRELCGADEEAEELRKNTDASAEVDESLW